MTLYVWILSNNAHVLLSVPTVMCAKRPYGNENSVIYSQMYGFVSVSRSHSIVSSMWPLNYGEYVIPYLNM